MNLMIEISKGLYEGIVEQGLIDDAGSEKVADMIIAGKNISCKHCKWWKDSDGSYRRGVGAESKCPMNTKAVCDGTGYCYMFEKKEPRKVEFL